jgi:quinol monooxygenase YgiN
MTKLAIVATIKISGGKRDAYLNPLRAHAERCLANESGTLQFDVLVPHNDADTLMLYEVYASAEAFQAHWNGESMKQMRRETEGLQASLSGVQCDLVT